MIADTLMAYANSLNWREGVTKHEQTHRVLLRAASLEVKPSQAVEIVLQKVMEAKGQVDSAGISRQCKRAYEYITGKSSATLSDNAIRQCDGSYTKPKLKEFSFEKLKQMTASFKGDISKEWFLERSPKRPRDAHEFLRKLYPLGESVALFSKLKQRKPEIIWNHDLPDFGQLVSEEGVFFLSNPVTGRRHLVESLKSEVNPTGETWWSNCAVTAWRYMLLESDLSEIEHPGVGKEWLKFLALLKAPVVSIVSSGGKSIHALVRIDATSMEDWNKKVRKYKEPFRELGADVNALTAVRLTRLPFCYRNGTLQELYYCDPDADSVSIAQKGGLVK